MAFQQQRPPQGGRQDAMNKTPRFADILSTAWTDHGLKRVTTAIVQFPNEENAWTTIVHATVETARGEFSAIGDANPKNAGPMIAPHSIRFAESRAIARALRWATNAGEAVDVEMGDYHPEQEPARPRPQPVIVDPGMTHAEARRPDGPTVHGTPIQAPDPEMLERQRQARAMNPPTEAAARPDARLGRDPGLIDLWSSAEASRDALASVGLTPAVLPADEANEATLTAYVGAARRAYAAKKAGR